MELLLEEINNVRKWTVISLLALSLCLFGYFIYKVRTGLLKSVTDIAIEAGLLIVLIPGIISFLIFEILSFKKLRQPLNVCVKRFFGRTIIISMLIFPLIFLLIIASNLNLLETENVMHHGTIIFFIWLGLTFLMLTKFKRAIQKLSNGKW